MGVETEHSATAIAGDGKPVASEEAIRLLLARASHRPHLRASNAVGYFLANGSLLYIDGAHPELATAEAATPEEVVTQVKAGEQLLEELAQEVCRASDVKHVLLSRTGVHYWPPATWGCHESISHQINDDDRLATMLIPLLATRMIYAGAGGFDASPSAGIQFVLSPRVPFLEFGRSTHSTRQRGIFHDRPATAGRSKHCRLHLLCGSSVYSQRAIWLKLGVVACVTALVEAGGPPPKGVQLTQPVAAMRSYAADPSLTAGAPVTGGGQATALDIQFAYLDSVEQYADHPAMPPWVDEVCIVWRSTLEQLASRDPIIEQRFDWAIKYKGFAALAQRRGFDFEALHRYGNMFRTLSSWGKCRWDDLVAAGDPCLAGWQAACRTTSAGRRKRATLRAIAEDCQLDYHAIPDLVRLRQQLFELDWRYGQLGADGLFARLDAAQQLDHQVCDADQIDRARDHPPEATRARLRGKWVARLHGEPDARCSWSAVHARRGVLDLQDPLADQEIWISAEEAAARSEPFQDLPRPEYQDAGAALVSARSRSQAGPAGRRRRRTGPELFDQVYPDALQREARGQYRDAHSRLGRLRRLYGLGRRRCYERGRLAFRLRARLGQIDDQEYRVVNQYHSSRRPPTLREIIEVLYVNRFGRLTPMPGEVAEWLEAGRRLAAPGSRLARYEPRLVAEFEEMLAYYYWLAGDIHAAEPLCRRLTAARVGTLLGCRESCWAIVTEAAVRRSLGDHLGAQRLVQRARQEQRRRRFASDAAEMTAPLAARLLIDVLPAGTSPDRVVDFALHEALHAIDPEQNPLGKMRVLDAYDELTNDQAARQQRREIEALLHAEREELLF